MTLPATQLFKSTCSYCGVGCGIEILKHPDGSMTLRGDASHPANKGMLCAKGKSLLHVVNARASRLHHPAMRTARNQPRTRINWDSAIGRIAGEFQRIIAAHGPDAVGLYVSGQCLTEEYYLANKIAKGFLGTNNIDTNSRLCMSSAACGYKATLGADGPPVSYDDIESADTFFIAGANPAWCHPILFRRIEARKEADPNVKVIVVDPRRTASCELADLHLAIRPGTDIPLFLAIGRELWKTGHFDFKFIEDHTDGFVDYAEALTPWTLDRAAETCGIRAADIATAAQWLSADRRFLTLWTMGLNQSAQGTDKNIALIQLSLATGKIGRPGCGPFSLTGQPNAMGGREVGGMATMLPAHRDLANPQHRAEVAAFWGVDTLPEKPGLTAVEMFDALHSGKMKAVWIIATNPVASLPDAWKVEEALKRAELVVVQDLYPTETADFADILLPAAGWLEKAGTMTNSDRRIALLEKAVEPPGEALSDVDILLKFARAMGWQKSFPFQNAAEVFAEHARLTAGTDIDITALSHHALRTHGPTQWPAPAAIKNQNSKIENPAPLGTPRLYTDGRFPTATGRALFSRIDHRPQSEPLSDSHPLILTTGRIRDQWHTMTKTGEVSKLRSHIDAPTCQMHPDDATPRAICDGDIVDVASVRGSVRVAAQVTADIRPGVVFLPMHWGKKLGGPRGRANNLTSPRLDPVSKEPDLKFAAVEVTRHVPPARRIVIIGGGAAALAFIQAHRRHCPADSITVFSDESGPMYNRVMLPQYIEGAHSFDALITADPAALVQKNVTLHRSTPIRAIQRGLKQVVDLHGAAHPYDLLVLATGSRPAIHYDGPVPATGIFKLRTRVDADAIIADAHPGRYAVIHGGGLLAVELADALLSRGCNVTILQRSDRLMAKQLDAIASAHLAEELTLRGIAIRFHTAPVELVGEERLTDVRISSAFGVQPLVPNDPATPEDPEILIPAAQSSPADTHESHIPADLFIFATGTVPNKELAGAAGLHCDRGILTNAFMQTSDPHIFALGECAECLGQLIGTSAGAQGHARALAEFLRGNEHAPHKAHTSANILKLRGFALATAGITDFKARDALGRTPEPMPPQSVTLHDPARRFYQKCLIENDRLVGVICMGDTSRFPQYLDWISTGFELDERRDELLRPGTATAPTEGALVCSCNAVGETTILRAAAECAGDLQTVCTRTRAGTGCGSCKPEVRRLISKTLPVLSGNAESSVPEGRGLLSVKN